MQVLRRALMERVYRASNGIYAYACFLVADTLVLGWEAAHRLTAGARLMGGILALLAVICLGCAAVLVWRWGRRRVVITSETLQVVGQRPAGRLYWSDVDRVREIRGPAYQLSLKHLLPGPYLPHALFRGETVLELEGRPATRIVLRQALVQGYNALRQDVLRSIPKDAEVDLHVRWWHT